MKQTLLLFSVLLLIGAGCASTPYEEPLPVAMPESESVAELPAYVGTWERQGTYVDGLLNGSYPATLEMDVDTFYSHNDICETAGTLEVDGDSITMAMDMSKTDCLVVPGYESITYTQSFNEDETEMTIVTVVEGVEVKEIYLRSE